MRVAYHHHHHHAHTLVHTTPTHASFRDTHLREKHLNHISYAPPRAPLCASVVPRPCHCTASFAFFRQNFVAHTHHTHSIHTHTCIPHLHHTHSHLCHAARRRLSRCVSPPCPLSLSLSQALATCASCAVVSWDSSHTHTHALHTHTCICCCCVYSPCLRLHPPLACTHLCSTLCVCLLTFRIIHIDLLKTRRQGKATVKRK